MNCGRKLILVRSSAHGFLSGIDLPCLLANTKRRSKKPGKRSSSIRTLPLAMTFLPSAINTLTAWRKPRTRFSGPPSANWKSLTSSSSDTTSPFLRGDKAGMEREAALGQGKSGAEDWISDHEAFVLAYSGHLQQARRMSRHAVDLAQQSAQRERAALFETGAALWEGLFRECARGKAERDGSTGAFQGTGTWSMALPLPWPSRGILPGLKHSRMIWKSASRRIRQSDSATCRRFARFSH